MKRGQKPKPVQRQLAEGDPAKRGVHKLDGLNAVLPKAKRGLPEPPSHLEGLAREQWGIWKQDLELMQMDYSADAVILEGACVNYARAIEADEILKDGCEVKELIFDRTTGDEIGFRLKNRPAVARSHSCWRNVVTLCAELGLTLMSRQRLAIEVGEMARREAHNWRTHPLSELRIFRLIEQQRMADRPHVRSAVFRIFVFSEIWHTIRTQNSKSTLFKFRIADYSEVNR